MNYITTTDLKGAARILGVSEDEAKSMLDEVGIYSTDGQYLRFKVESLRDTRKARGLK